MTENLNKTCQTCYSTGRRLWPMTNFKMILAKLNLWAIPTDGKICWECKATVKKFYNFKLRALELQRLIAKASQTKINPVSTLVCQTKKIYDYEFNFNEEIKIEVVKVESLRSEIHIKEEISVEFEAENNFNETDDQVFQNEGTDKKTEVKKRIQITNAKNERKRMINSKKTEKKNGKKGTSIDENELKKKFKTKVYTEKQLLMIREKKKKDPYFKYTPFKCDSCILGFSSTETYDSHVETNHNENIGMFQCKICATRFPDQDLLHKHTQEHYISYCCVFCDYETVSQHAVITHCKEGHLDDDVRKVQCTYCGIVYASAEELESHKMSKHTLPCDKCGKIFNKMRGLRKHKARIHSERKYICDICQKSYITKSRLESHMTTHSEDLAKNLAYCSECKVQYKNIYIYRNHLKTNTNHSEKAHRCTECNKSFASRAYLRKHHDFYHLGKSPYKCNVCKKLCISEWKLLNHKQTQHGLARTRNHVCSVCGKKFFTKSTLRTHQLTHSEQRSYMCEDCGDTFKQRAALYNHCKLVHKGVKRNK